MIQEHVVPAIVAISATTPVEELSARPATPGALTMDPVVVVIIDGRVVVVSDSPEGPVIKLSQEIDPATYTKGVKGEHSRVTTKKGIHVAWIKDTSCACGSRLKTWRPYKHIGSINDPGPDD